MRLVGTISEMHIIYLTTAVESWVITQAELTGKRTQRTSFKSPHLFSKVFYEKNHIMRISAVFLPNWFTE
jgi:hypothetical protein